MVGILRVGQPARVRPVARRGVSAFPATRPAAVAPYSGLAAALSAPASSFVRPARAELQPVLDAIKASVLGQARSGAAAISGYANSAAASLGAIDFGAPYAGAEQRQASVDSALAQALAGGGAQAAQDLSARLAQIGEPGVTGAAANAVAATGAGLANTELARGSSNLGALIADAAAAGSYGQKLPGVARLAGLQALAANEGQASKSLADSSTQVLGQLPAIANELRSASVSRATELYNAQVGEQSAAATAAYRQAQLAQGDRRINADAAYKGGRLALGQQSLAALAKYRAGELDLRGLGLQLQQDRLATQTAPRPNASLSRAAGHLVDQYGQDVGATVGGSVPFTGVSTAGMSPELLRRVQAAAAAVGATGIVITSGRRAPGPGNDVSNSNHISGNALDGYAIVNGKRVPIGAALKGVAGKYGLRSGDVAGFDPKTAGGFDPIHVDDGANVHGGTPLPASFTSPAAHGKPLPGFRYDPATGQYVKTSTSTGKGGVSSATARTAFGNAVKLATKARGAAVVPGGPLLGGVEFPKAYNQLVAYFVGVGYGGGDAKRLSLQALGAAGWTVPTQVDVRP